MKVFVTIMIAVAAANTASAQGTIDFRNRIGSGATAAMWTPVYGPNPANPTLMQQGNATTNINPGPIDYTGHPLLIGTGFTVALFAGPVGTPPEALAYILMSVFSTSVSVGGIWEAREPYPGVPNATPGGNATAQVRAWDNQNFTLQTWAQVMAASPNVPRGVSAPFTLYSLGDPNDATKRPATLIGMTSFNIAIVPEPGVIALGLLGFGVLLLRRRK
jgi:hypothetical protein